MVLIFQSIFDSPIGKLLLYATKDVLVYIGWKDAQKKIKLILKDEGVIQFLPNTENKIINQAKTELNLYFKHRLTQFEVPILLKGTPFQEKIWKTLLEIPYGTTYSYKDIAKKAGSPKAVRAVGNANGKNPIPIIVPCHRVIQSNGDIGGYSAGIRIKYWLLKHEGII